MSEIDLDAYFGADRDPDTLEPAGLVNAVKGRTVPLGDIFGDLEEVVSVVGRAPQNPYFTPRGS